MYDWKYEAKFFLKPVAFLQKWVANVWQKCISLLYYFFVVCCYLQQQAMSEWMSCVANPLVGSKVSNNTLKFVAVCRYDSTYNTAHTSNIHRPACHVSVTCSWKIDSWLGTEASCSSCKDDLWLEGEERRFHRSQWETAAAAVARHRRKIFWVKL